MKTKGFTLIELAIVIAIVGILIAGGTQVMKIQKEQALAKQAKKDVIAAKDAIIGNTVINNNTIPNNDDFQKYLSPRKQNQHPLLYAYDDTLTSKNVCRVASTDFVVDIRNKTEGTRKKIKNVAFIVVADGANRNMQTAYDSAKKRVKLYYPKDSVDDNKTDKYLKEPYDDVAEWVTLAELQDKVDCSKYKLKIITDAVLPRDKSSNNDYLNDSNATIYAADGFPYSDGYDWCIENAPLWLNKTDCGGSALANCSSGRYSRCDAPKLDGDPSLAIFGGPGVYTFKMHVKDSAGNEVIKDFTIAIDNK